jgi:lincosamide nucleotidyltransferase A/C/D/E
VNNLDVSTEGFMVNKEDAIEIISYAVDNGIDIWLDGGWGVDALLGTQTRVHNDIDLFVEKINSKKFIDIIKEKGFSEIEEAYTTASHTVWKDTKGRIIDLHIFEFNEQGNLVFEGETYSGDVFSGIGKISNKVVKCISAENQVLFHLGYEHDENDVHDVRLLCERFNIPIPNEYK